MWECQVRRQGVDETNSFGKPWRKFFPQGKSSFKIASCGVGVLPCDIKQGDDIFGGFFPGGNFSVFPRILEFF
jgi:hypothetical protein